MLFFRILNLKYHYSNVERIDKIRSPILIIHGDEDIKINVSHSLRLFNCATSLNISVDDTNDKFTGVLQGAYPIEFHIIRGSGHNEVYSSRQFLSILPAFITSIEL
jgi:fermentation-respiration switch protein FrsA (DUF1100 family)